MDRIGRYTVREQLARGGMGIVYRARSSTDTRDVAVKLLVAGAGANAIQREHGPSNG